MQATTNIAALLLSAFLISGAAIGQDDDQWTDLFNGEDTSGWNNPYEWGEVNVVDGEIHLTASKKFFLVTDKKYGDFVFEGEVMIPEGQANSGFMFRCHSEKNKVFGYQAECDGSDRRWSGGLYDESRRGWIWPSIKGRTKEAKFLEHAEESQAYFKKPEVAGALDRNGWNKYRITCQGDSLKIEVNGVVTTEIEDDTDASGFIAIQHHGEKGQTYRFRNLRIKELKPQS
ncbi:3-keto-disaccharide hydrolase [Rosistilla oblonga]|uniref:3-keto-disaccharide hydrolase n=1 Tax=Rosistilla oblonga TaxID=2527990 RepID=UPI003A96D8CD